MRSPLILIHAIEWRNVQFETCLKTDINASLTMVPVNDHVCNDCLVFGRFALPPIPLNYYEEARPGCLRPPEVCLYYLGFAVNRHSH